MNKNFNRLLRLVLLFTVYPLSFLVPRKKNLWVFGCDHNKFSDNAKFQYLWTANNAKKIEVVWISGSKEAVEKLQEEGYSAYMRWSMTGLIKSLRASIYIYSSYINDVNFYTSGMAKRVNLWHGVGLKKIEFKIKQGPFKKCYETNWWNPYRIFAPSIFIRPDLFLSTSPLMTEHFSESFRISKENCFEGMYPRLSLYKDLIVMDQALKFGKYNFYQDLLKSYGKRWIYMPTWRPNNLGCIAKAIPNVMLLNQALAESNSILIIKAHPNENIQEIKQESNIYFWDNSIDIYPVLHHFDALITDYSSILYDFIALDKKEIILYNYDFEAYKSQSDDFAYPYEDNVTGKVITEFSDLCKTISSKEILCKNFNDEILLKFFSNQNGTMENIHNKIKELGNV